MANPTAQRRLEEALIRDDPACADLADGLPIEQLTPLLAKYAKPVHPYGTRERVLECLERRDEWQAVELLATFLDHPGLGDQEGQHDLSVHAAAILARKDCSSIANEILGIATRDITHLLQLAPALMGLTRRGGPAWRTALEGLRSDLDRLLRLTDNALVQLDDVEPSQDDPSTTT